MFLCFYFPKCIQAKIGRFVCSNRDIFFSVCMHVYIFAIFLSKNCFYSRNRASLNFAILFGTALSLSFSLSWRVRQLYLCSCSSSNFCPIVLQLCVVGALYLFFSQNKAGARGRFMLCCFLSFFHFIFCSYICSRAKSNHDQLKTTIAARNCIDFI